jgi:hypothetical protein
MSDRFDLEQEILACWTIVDDLQFMLDNCDSWTEDERLNYLIGLSVKYNKRFEHLFGTFELMIKNELAPVKTESVNVSPTVYADNLRDAYDHETYLDSLADR